jgi:hypothetical protein
MFSSVLRSSISRCDSASVFCAIFRSYSASIFSCACASAPFTLRASNPMTAAATIVATTAGAIDCSSSPTPPIDSMTALPATPMTAKASNAACQNRRLAETEGILIHPPVGTVSRPQLFVTVPPVSCKREGGQAGGRL